MNDITVLMATMKAAAEKATALNLDTAQEIRDEDGCTECPVCGGEGHVDAERDYCNIDNVALGVQFYGIGEQHGIAEEYFRQVVPANVLALVEALEKTQTELESFRTAFTEWSDKTEWMRGDKRFDALKPWGKHQADVLKAYIEHLESRTVTVKLPTSYAIRPGHPINEGERGVMIPKDGGTWLSRFDVEHALQVAGIQVIEGEGQ
ncbi:hypothetical protein ACM26E_08645 [Kluyvera cryocrescens]|uniref:hypothetical protein n=1 Tax=Kluyvera cryocrescens TaxID=580 RepID=UPI0039F63E48